VRYAAHRFPYPESFGVPYNHISFHSTSRSLSALSISAAPNIMDQGHILKIGNVAQNDSPIPKRPTDQQQHSVFMWQSTILSDAVDERLSRLFSCQARDTTFAGTWQTHIQKRALRLI
jgi:hypothetical protein